MKFIDKYVFKDDRFSVGFEETTGKYYISIPVANPYAGYDEYYEIDPNQYRSCPNNLDELKMIVEKCRARTNDARLMMPLGKLRGSPI